MSKSRSRRLRSQPEGSLEGKRQAARGERRRREPELFSEFRMKSEQDEQLSRLVEEIRALQVGRLREIEF